MSRHARIELLVADIPADGRKPSARPHYLRLVAANGQVLAHSENYSTRQNARRAIGAWTDAFWQVACPVAYSSPVIVEFDADGERVTR